MCHSTLIIYISTLFKLNIFFIFYQNSTHFFNHDTILFPHDVYVCVKWDTWALHERTLQRIEWGHKHQPLFRAIRFRSIQGSFKVLDLLEEILVFMLVQGDKGLTIFRKSLYFEKSFYICWLVSSNSMDIFKAGSVQWSLLRSNPL